MKKQLPYFFPFLTSVLFALAIFAGVAPRETWAAATQDSVALVAKGLLAAAFLVLAAWFLDAFTPADRKDGDNVCQAEQRASMFRFAYMFALFSFALLVLPFTAMVRTHETTPDAGPIRLLRACWDLQPSAPSAVAPAPAPVAPCPGADQPGLVSYPWLLSVGGVVARECGTGDLKCSKSAEVRAAAVSDAESGPKPPTPPALYRVQGGLVVPFYVAVFAFVGGVVNLTRRVPEYQKRSSCEFAGTASESRVTLLECREFVVFQLMQLVSSPFIAMVAYYALEPKSVASAVAIAFFSGFATESVLLVLRGMFSGLQPATTKTAASAPKTSA